jgi:hypothetical protein
LGSPVGSDERRVHVWVLDKHRYWLLPVIRRIQGKRGVRVYAPYATKHKWGYLHEALEVDGGNADEPLFRSSLLQSDRPHTFSRLERHIEAVAKDGLRPAKLASINHDWLLDKVNGGSRAQDLEHFN